MASFQWVPLYRGNSPVYGESRPDYVLEFAHGYTYSAHPVACAAGLAALRTSRGAITPRVADEAPYLRPCF